MSYLLVILAGDAQISLSVRVWFHFAFTEIISTRFYAS